MNAWAKQRVPHYVATNPFIAYAFARVVLAHLEDRHEAGADDARAPIYLLEVGAGSGRFAFHFLDQFFDLLDASPLRELDVRYVMTDVVDELIDTWAAHPKFRRFTAAGRLDFARFDAESDTVVDLRRSGTRLAPGSLANPPVVLATYVFDSLAADLFFVDAHVIRAGGVRLVPRGQRELAVDETPDRDDPFTAVDLEYRMAGPAVAPYADQSWNALLQSYAATLPDCALFFPSTTLSFVRRLRALHPGGDLLFLIAGRNTATLTELAAQREPALGRHGSLSFPVNYHALREILAADGGFVRVGDDSTENLAMFAAAFQHSRRHVRLNAAIDEWFGKPGPNAYHSLKVSLAESAAQASPDDLHAVLEVSRWDAVLFLVIEPRLRAVLPEAPLETRQRWATALRNVWRRHLPIGEPSDVAFHLGVIAASIQNWRLAADFFQASLVTSGPHSATLFNLASARQQLGDIDEAQRHLAAALEADPGVRLYARARAELEQWQIDCRQFAHGNPPAGAAPHGARLRELPLAPQHAHALAYRFRDPETVRLTRLPVLETAAAARMWIEAQRADPRTTALAVVHPDMGLIGVTMLQRSGNDALATYWIGKDFQGRGLGREALSLLLDLAKHLGITRVFASVLAGNDRSRALLRSAGFRVLPCEAAVSDDDMLEFHDFAIDAADVSADDAMHALARVLRATGSSLKVVPLSNLAPPSSRV